MFTKIKKLMKNEKGMTLIELLAVLVIIAIVAVIAIPAIGNIINNSKDKAILADASNILAGAKIAVTDGACTENSDKSISCTETQLKNGYLDNVSGTGFAAKKNTDGTWSVTYPKLKDIKNDKFKVTGVTDTSQVATEANLNTALTAAK